jgi:hypothetical protein
MSTQKVSEKSDREFFEHLKKAVTQSKTTSGALIAALIGGLLKLAEITRTFPPPADLAGNIIIFFAVLIIAADTARGGLLD